MAPIAPSLRRAISVSLAALTAACGASYQSVYENDLKFEHCYALDSTAKAPDSAKYRCWAEWSRLHAVGQTRDRVDYAFARERALSAGGAAPSLMSLEHVAASSPPTLASPLASAPAIACPLPNSPYESPPATLRQQPASRPAAGPPAAPPSPPSVAPVSRMTATQECVHECGDHFTQCATECKQPTCVNRCSERTKLCIAQCL